MLYNQIGKTALSCAIATAIGFTLPEASSAQAIPLSTSPTAERLVAQAVPPSPPSLTATGYGRAFAPVDQAAVIVSYALNYYPEITSEDGMLPQPPVAQPSDLSEIVDALVNAGIARSAISVSLGAHSFQSLRLIIRVDSPTRERLNELIELSNNTAIEDSRFIANTSGVVYTARDCQATENAARQLAIDDARAQTTALASGIGVQAGDLLSASGSVTWSYSTPFPAGCPSNLDDILSYTGLYGAQFYDPLLPPQVPVDVSVSLTYGIAE